MEKILVILLCSLILFLSISSVNDSGEIAIDDNGKLFQMIYILYRLFIKMMHVKII